MFTKQLRIKSHFGIVAVCMMGLLIGGCLGDNNPVATTVATATVSGSAGDGPVVGGTVTVVDANGTTIGTAQTDANAHYSIAVPATAVLPLTVTITGGIDQVTGLAPDFPLKTAVTSALSTVTDTNANANPLSTIAVESALALGGITAANLQTAVNNVRDSLGFGADFDPIGTVITAANVGKAVKANEAAAELIRRATKDTGKSIANTIKAIAEDLTDGAVDGNVASGVTATQVSAQVAAQIQAKIAEVSVEAMTNTLKVTTTTGAVLIANATSKLNSAVTTSIAAATTTMAQIPVSAAFIQQARAAVQASNALATGSATTGGALKNLDTALAGLTAGAVAPASLATTVTAALTQLATATTNASAGTNVTAANTAAAGASRFKLGSNTGSVQDYNAANTALATFNTSAGTFSAGALIVNLGTALNSGNLSNLASATPTGTAPKITFTLANLKAGSGTAQLTATLIDNITAPAATRVSGERQLVLVYNFTWTSDGTTLTLTPVTGNTTATYFTTNGTASVAATITNAQANILSSTGGVALNVAVSNLYSTTSTLSTALGAVTVVGNYYYQLDFTGFPLADAGNNVVTRIKGTFGVL